MFNKNHLFILVLAFCSNFARAGYFPMYSSWPQPGGAGSPITLTYSYSNLFDGSLIDSATGEAMTTPLMRNIFETAFWDYANVLPIDFVEISDNGPLPETGEYDPSGLADIRIGLVPHIDSANAYAYFPRESSGLAGDIVFNAKRSGFNWSEVLFYAVAQHEIGHSLGMGHFINDAPSTTALFDASLYQGPLFPLTPGMVTALQGVYGAGTGSVTPVPLPAALYLFVSAMVGLMSVSRRRPVDVNLPVAFV